MFPLVALLIAAPPPDFSAFGADLDFSAFVPAMAPDDPYRLDYADFHRMVGNGITGWLAVGVDDPWVHTYLTHCRVPAGFGGLANGLYRCYLKDGKQVVEPWKRSVDATPEVVAKPTFRQSGIPRLTLRTIAPSVVAPSTSFPAPVPSRGVIRTLAPQGTLGGVNCTSYG